jgi:hypothetical protein
MDDKHGRLADALQAAKSKGRRYDDSDNERKKKKESSLHYKRRKLDKDVRKYIRSNNKFNSKEIDEIGRQHGFYIE